MTFEPEDDLSDLPPDIRERLAEAHDMAADQIIELACVDMVERWRGGKRIPVEAYAALHPTLRADEHIFDLIYLEWNLRTEIGEPTTADEYLWRFPRQATRILAQGSLDELIREAVDTESAPIDHDFFSRVETLSNVGESSGRRGAGWPTPSGYEIEAEIGRGGMGIVFRARQSQLNRVVALKMILAEAHALPETISRFLGEAQMIARLRHPSIVQIHTVGEHEGLPFLELEFVSGGSLAARLDGTPWPARQAATLIESMAQGIEQAHRLGVIHRDLKPANILMAEDGTPKVADFGIAKWLGGDSGLTHTQSILGSPSYMAPEQADGRNHEVGPASDVYALGAIFYELLTGRPPFKASSLLLTLEQVKKAEPVPPTRLQPGLPRDAETICLRCLQKSPSRRYLTAEALAEDLRRFSAREPILARPSSFWEKVGRWCQRSPAIAALSVALVLTMGGGVAGILYKWRDAETQRRAALVFGRKAQVSSDEAQRTLNASQLLTAGLILDQALLAARQGDVARGLILMLESMKMAPANASGFHEMIRRNLADWRHRLHRLERIHVYESEVVNVAYSPDGTVYIVSCGNGSARLYDAATGSVLWQPKSLGKSGDCLAFSPDSKWVLIGGGNVAQVFETRTGRVIGQPMIHPGRVLRGSFSPDGKLLVTTYNGPTALIWNASTGEPVGHPLTLVRNDQFIFCARFTLDGKGILAGLRHRDDLKLESEVAVWDAQGGLPIPGKSLPHPAGVLVLEYSRDGHTLLTACADGRVRLFKTHDNQLVRSFVADPALVEPAIFSPDGQQIVTGGPAGLAKWWNTADGRPLGSALKHQAAIWGLAFSPDGRFILTGSADKSARLWKVARDFAPVLATDTGPATEPNRDPGNESVIKIALFSPGGTRSLTVGDDGTPHLRDLISDKEISTSLSPGAGSGQNVLGATFSADGRQVAIAVQDASEKSTIQIWDDRWRLVSSLPQEATIDAMAFSPDGKRLAVSGNQGLTHLWDVSLKKRVGFPLKNSGTIQQLAFRPDGSAIAASTDNGPIVVQWNFNTGRMIGRPLPWSLGTARIEYSSDGQLLLTAAAQAARLWIAATGEPYGHPIALSAPLVSAMFGPQSRTILTYGSDGEACLWDPIKGEPLLPRMRHEAPITAIAIDASSRFVLTGYGDGTAQLWDVARTDSTRATGRPIGPPIRLGSAVLAATFLPGADAIATIDGRGETRTFPIPRPMTEKLDALTLRLELETASRVDVEKSAMPILPELWLKYRRQLQLQTPTSHSAIP